jgi:alkylresorcinol/alkylpyrone synthase
MIRTGVNGPATAQIRAGPVPGAELRSTYGQVDVVGLGTALPRHRVTNSEVAAAMPRIWPRLARRTGTLLAESGTFERHLARSLEEMATGLPLGVQTARYLEAATDLSLRASRDALDRAAVDTTAIGCLITVSCTGFVLPGLDARLIPALGLRDDVARMPFTQFGCAGGAAGLARACEWVRARPQEAALVVAVELPSVTFRPADTTTDNLLSALVFGDGAAAAVLRVPPPAALDGRRARGWPAIGRSSSVLVPDTVDALGYELADDGYKVILSRSLPDVLSRSLPAIVGRFLCDTSVRDVDIVVAHPGGPAILDAIQGSLGISDSQIAASWASFRRTGNTSSAAVLFVLAELEVAPPRPGATGLLVAVGPGLSIELLELTWPA